MIPPLIFNLNSKFKKISLNVQYEEVKKKKTPVKVCHCSYLYLWTCPTRRRPQSELLQTFMALRVCIQHV